MADVKPPPDKKWASLLDNVLVSIVDDDQNEQIYTDYYSNEFSEFHPLLKQAQWGEYTTKPIAQTKWEKEVAFTIASLELDPEPIAAAKDSDFRHKLFDKKSGRWLLLDPYGQGQISHWLSLTNRNRSKLSTGQLSRPMVPPKLKSTPKSERNRLRYFQSVDSFWKFYAETLDIEKIFAPAQLWK